jgi:hypothetical protein
MGDKVGRVHIQQSDLKTLELRKFARNQERQKKRDERKAEFRAKEQAEVEGEAPTKKVKTE